MRRRPVRGVSSTTFSTDTPSRSSSSRLSLINFCFSCRLSPNSFQRSASERTRTICSPSPVSDSRNALATRSCASANDSAPSRAEVRPFTQSAMSRANTTPSEMSATRMVCHDTHAPSSCLHTGTAFFPEAASSSFCLRTSAIASASMGRLFDMARMNICGPIASEGSSLATWLNCIRRLFVLRSTVSVSMSMELLLVFCCSFCSSFSPAFSPLICPVSACTFAASVVYDCPAFLAASSWEICSARTRSSAAISRRVWLSASSTLLPTDRSPAWVRSLMNISSSTGSAIFLQLIVNNE